MTNESVKPPVWFWVVSAIALIWNGMGIMNYLDQAYMTAEKLATLPEADQAMYQDNPAWVTAAFAISVFAGAIGCVLLLLRKKLAHIILVISFLAVFAQLFYAFVLSDAPDPFGPGGLILAIMIIGIGAALVYLAKRATTNGWLS